MIRRLLQVFIGFWFVMVILSSCASFFFFSCGYRQHLTKAKIDKACLEWNRRNPGNCVKCRVKRQANGDYVGYQDASQCRPDEALGKGIF